MSATVVLDRSAAISAFSVVMGAVLDEQRDLNRFGPDAGRNLAYNRDRMVLAKLATAIGWDPQAAFAVIDGRPRGGYQ